MIIGIYEEISALVCSLEVFCEQLSSQFLILLRYCYVLLLAFFSSVQEIKKTYQFITLAINQTGL